MQTQLPGTPTPPAVPFNVFGSERHSTIVVPTKGLGKYASYGTPVPLPHPLVDAHDPESHSTEQQPTQETPGAASSSAAAISPIMATEADVQSWYADGWYPLTLSSDLPAAVGERVLWLGARRGRSGGLSTKQEYFNGVVHNLEVVDNDLFYDIS